MHAGGQSTIPELQAVLGGMEALDRTTNNAWKTEQGRIMATVTFEASAIV